jgi:hypothetical protein
MWNTIAIQRYSHDRVEDLHREAARVTAIRRARATSTMAAGSCASVGSAVTTCCGPLPACCWGS